MPDQRLRPPRRDDLPAQDRQPHDVDLPVPRLDVPQRRHAAQGEGPRRRRLPRTFNVNGSHNLTNVARFESYRGFLFGSLNPDVMTAGRALGDTTKVIDMLVDQSPEGLEVLRGSSTYTYDGNWKVQAENGADGTTSPRRTGTTRPPPRAAAPASPRTKPRCRRRRLGKSAAATGPSERPPVPVDLGGQPAGPPSLGPASTNSRRNSARPRASSWSTAPATSACTRMSI